MINAGKYNKRILIRKLQRGGDPDDFLRVNDQDNYVDVIRTWASVKTTRGMTVIKSGSDFEKVYTNFTIRYPRNVTITRKMRVIYKDKVYCIDYVNNVDEDDTELELQCYEVSQ